MLRGNAAPGLPGIRQSSFHKNDPKVKEKEPEEAIDYLTIQREIVTSESQRPALYGILSIKVLSFTPTPGTATLRDVYVEIVVRNFSARTSASKLLNGKYHFEQQKHFPLRIPRSRAHPCNLVKIYVAGSIENRWIENGSLSFHLHDIIRGSPVTGEFELVNDHFEIGGIELEITFNYGIFGYGNSLQLQLSKHPEDAISCSLLPRINPPKEKCKLNEPVLAVQAVPHPKFIPFESRAFLSYGAEFQNELEELGNSLYLPQTFLKDYSKMAKVREQYFSMQDRATRLKFIHNYLQQPHKRVERVAQEASQEFTIHFPPKEYIRFTEPNKESSRIKKQQEEMNNQANEKILRSYLMSAEDIMNGADNTSERSGGFLSRLFGFFTGAK
ncbi:hypothetical protein EDD86DRAFT_203060 [Gorgonomyces haynaldii]|nr:hypothetical protein EDD86DRAFT_203060 [Gorgonomyces haynaldii]